MLKFSAWLACVTGIIVAGTAIAINQGALPADEAFHDVYYVVVRPGAWITVFAAICLLAAGTATLRGLKPGRAVLAWAWGFVCPDPRPVGVMQSASALFLAGFGESFPQGNPDIDIFAP